MRKLAIWLLGIGGAALVLFTVILPLLVGHWPVFMEGEIDRRRLAIEIVVTEGDREVRNTVQNECITSRSGGVNTGRQIGTHKEGEPPFAILPSGRVLTLTGHFNPCSTSAGVYDASLPHGESRDGRIYVPGESAELYDSIDNPKVRTSYRLPEMFQAGAEGVRIKEMKLSEISVSGELPRTLASSFPWLGTQPGVGSPDYDKDHHQRNFQGPVLTMLQLEGPCAGMAPDVAEPQLNQDAQFNRCRGRGKQIGRMIGKPNADFSELQFSTDEASPLQGSRRYLEAMLREIAPGKWRPATELSPRRYAWTPRLCIDGYCFRPEPQQYLVWTKYELYLPKSKRIVQIDPD